MNDDTKAPEPDQMPAQSPVAPPVPEEHAPYVPPVMPGQQVVVSNHSGSKPKWYSKRFVRPAAAALVVLLVAAAAWFFGLYWPNTPANVYSASLVNSGKAQDTLINYAVAADKANYKSTAFDGSLKVKSSAASFDMTLNGSYDKDANATANLDIDVLGEKATANVLSVKKQGNTSPDVYVKVSGVKSLLESDGLGSLANLDGQWIAIDHTILDTYVSALQQSVGTDLSGKDSVPTSAQLEDAATKVAAVNKMYLYTADTKTAVLTDEKYIGQEQADGRTLDHYTVGYNKEHLQAYVGALASALDSSSLNTWSKKVNSGKNLSEVMDFSSLKSDISSLKSSYTFDLWADTGTKLVSKLAFTDPTDSTALLTISQNYTGGTSYPFAMTVKDKDSSGNPESAMLNMTVDTSTNKVSLGFTVSTQASDGTTTVDGSATITPSNNAVSVTAPKGAKSVVDILNELGLSNFTPSSTASPFSM